MGTIQTGKTYSKDTTNTANSAESLGSGSVTTTETVDFHSADRAFYASSEPGLTSLQDILNEFNDAPEEEGMAQEIRKEVAEQYYDEQTQTLTSLRLSKGLSQTEFATKIGRQQPYVSRVETNEAGSNLTRSIMKEMCRVLDVDMNTLDMALDNQTGINKA